MPRTTTRLSAPIAVLSAVVLVGCHPERVSQTEAPFMVSPGVLDFGQLYLGAERTLDLTVSNPLRASRMLFLSAPAPFAAAQRVEVQGGERLEIPVSFRPVLPGSTMTLLTITSERDVMVIPLSGEGVASLACDAGECEEVFFDPDAGSCRSTSRPDGSPCHSACLEGPTCMAGRCVGSPRDCDDGNACTVDACSDTAGCTHAPVECDAGMNPCLAAACDPAKGCSFSPVTDGTSCGADVCGVAHICLHGTCQTRAAPSTTTCPKVLITGGYDSNAYIWSSSELYDVTTESWQATNALNGAREGHSATLLPSGKVLVAGGYAGYEPLTTAELYDPDSGTWSTAGSLAFGECGFPAILLHSGKVLIAGGPFVNSPNWPTAEIYDPGSGTWSVTGSFNTPHLVNAATLLPSGEVLVAGGETKAAEVYDPDTGTWRLTGSLNVERTQPAAVLLPSGQVLIVGGYNYPGCCRTALSSAELYDPSSGSWTLTGSMTTPREAPRVALLQSGKVLVIGGDASSEIYDPGTETWRISGSLTYPRSYPSMILLPNGKVLVAGGDHPDDVQMATAEIYDPQTETWSMTGSMSVPRDSFTMTVLP